VECDGDVIYLFRGRDIGGYENLAELVAKNGVSLREFDITGNVVMAAGSDNKRALVRAAGGLHHA